MDKPKKFIAGGLAAIVLGLATASATNWPPIEKVAPDQSDKYTNTKGIQRYLPQKVEGLEEDKRSSKGLAGLIAGGVVGLGGLALGAYGLRRLYK